MIMVFAFLLLAGKAYAQEKAKEDTTRVNELLTQSKALFGEDPAKAVVLATQAHDLAVKLNYQKGQATALKNIGVGYYYQQKNVEALDYWNRSLKIFESLHDEVGISNLLNNMGAVYMDQGDDGKALEYSLHALQIAEKIQDKNRIIASLIGVGGIYHNKNDPRAIDYLLKALPLSEESGDKKALAVLLGNIGEVYFDQGDDNKALSYYQRAINTEPGSAGSAFAYNGLGKVNLRRKDFGQALQNHKKALGIAEKVQDKLQELRAYRGMANVYVQKQDFPTALNFYNKAKDLGEEIDANIELKDIYQEMATAYAKVPDFQNAFVYKTKYADIKDTLYNIETAKKVGKLQFDFDLYKKEGEINMLTKEKQLNESKLKIVVIASFVFLIVAISLWRLNKHKQRALKLLQQQKTKTDRALHELKSTQSQLIQAEKMASLGELTAGIAHEIQNPLNFINNFSELSSELVHEMEEMVQKGDKEEALALAADVQLNLQKIAHHGKRADGIVKGMLLHSNQSTSVKEPTDINALAEETLKLTYHSFRSKDKAFNVVLETHYDPAIGHLNVQAKEIGKVLLNLYSNAFYAVNERKMREGDRFEPVISVSTKKESDHILITVSDNGTGIKQQVVKKIFQPFFTTKPTGEGTGLGLSLCYEIITRGHGGKLKVESKEGEGAEFTVDLPMDQ